MKYGLVSDLHFDKYTIRARETILDIINAAQIDHLLIAGDFCDGTALRDYVLSNITHPYTYVLGNHDYFDETLTDFHGVFAGVTYATLWSNFRESRPNAVIAYHGVKDFYAIRVSPTDYMVPHDMHALFHAQKDMIESNPNDVVMTHFPPHLNSISPKYKGDPLNPYFCNDIPDGFIEKAAQVWVHGHVHTPCDYMVGQTRIIANPLGYPRENYEYVEDYEVVVFEV